MANNKQGGSGKAVGLGAGVAVAAALGAYFLAGKKGAANRKKVKGWMASAQTELANNVKKLERVSAGAYEKAAREVAARYRKLPDVDAKEVAAFVADAKKYWGMMKKTASDQLKRSAAPKRTSSKKPARTTAARKKK